MKMVIRLDTFAKSFNNAGESCHGMVLKRTLNGVVNRVVNRFKEEKKQNQ